MATCKDSSLRTESIASTEHHFQRYFSTIGRQLHTSRREAQVVRKLKNSGHNKVDEGLPVPDRCAKPACLQCVCSEVCLHTACEGLPPARLPSLELERTFNEGCPVRPRQPQAIGRTVCREPEVFRPEVSLCAAAWDLAAPVYWLRASSN